MIFKFEAVNENEYTGGSYLMDFGEMIREEDAAIVEGKLLTLFGAPAYTSENYEDSFNYFIRATAGDSRSVVLNVYGAGTVHIGADQHDSFTQQAANALIEYVNSAKPTDFSRKVYYLDFGLEIDISVKNGAATLCVTELTEEKAEELINKWYS